MSSEATYAQVIVRDATDLRELASTDKWVCSTMIASLSSNPRDFDEFRRAWLRYRPEEPLEGLGWRAWRGHQPPGKWLLIDLAGTRLVAHPGVRIPDDCCVLNGTRSDGKESEVWINYHPSWTCQSKAEWSALPEIPPPVEPLDARGILFGRSLCDGIARRVLEVARVESLPAEYLSWDDWGRGRDPSKSQREALDTWHQLTIRVHADWLMTPREDLEGETPRFYLHRERSWLECEIENRQTQWCRERRAPRPIDRDTFAYRFGPIGNHEVVMYFDLCRAVIGQAWRLIVESPNLAEVHLAAKLYEHVQWWLAKSPVDNDPTPPGTIIDMERRHMPITADNDSRDPDCPVCQLQGEEDFSPTFCIFDGHHLELDDEFAFSMIGSRDEWEFQYGV